MSNQQLLAEFVYKQHVPDPEQIPVVEQAITTLSQWACPVSERSGEQTGFTQRPKGAEDEHLKQLVTDAQEKLEESKGWVWE